MGPLESNNQSKEKSPHPPTHQKYSKKHSGALRAPDCFISLYILCFWAPNTPKFPGALRAPDCFISLCSGAFRPQIPQKHSGALRAPDYFISCGFGAFGNQIPQNYPARFARLIASIPRSFCCIWVPDTPKIPRRASRAGLLHFPSVLLLYASLRAPNTPKIWIV